MFSRSRPAAIQGPEKHNQIVVPTYVGILQRKDTVYDGPPGLRLLGLREYE